MRIVLFGAVGLAVGITAGTGVSALKQKKVLEAELQARQDSLAAAQADSLASAPEGVHAEPSYDPSPAAQTASAEEGGGRAPDAEGELADVAAGDGEEETQGGLQPGPGSPSASEDAGAASQAAPGGQGNPDAGVQGAGSPGGGGAGTFAGTSRLGGNPGPGQTGEGDAEEAGEEGPRRLAKIFGAMDPKEAAAVLENLANAEAQTILRHISERKVAAILSHFEPARAATLSRVVMGLETGEAEKPESGDETGAAERPDTARASAEPGGAGPDTGTGAADGKAGGEG